MSKKTLIKLACENPNLRGEILSFLCKKGAIKKHAGVKWVTEFVKGGNLNKAFKDVRDRDFKETQKEALEAGKEDPEALGIFFQEPGEGRIPVEVSKKKIKKLLEEKERALQKIEDEYDENIRIQQEMIDFWEKSNVLKGQELEKKRKEKLDEIMKDKPGKVKSGLLTNYLTYSGNFAGKNGVEKVVEEPVSLKEAEEMAKQMGRDGMKWDEVAEAIPIGKKGKIDGWYLFCWAAN